MNRPRPAPDELSTLLQLLRPLSGNELKLCLVIVDRALNKQPLTINALAQAADLDRTTIMRLIPSLCDKGFLEIVPTDRAMGLYESVRRQMIGGPEVSVMLRLPALDAVAISDRENGLHRSQNATETVANSDRATLKAPSQQLTGTGKTQQGYASPYVRRAKDLARQTAKYLNDLHSLGMHTQLWYDALQEDERTGTATLENTILGICSDLRNRYDQTGRHQGAAFTARVKAAIRHAKDENRQTGNPT